MQDTTYHKCGTCNSQHQNASNSDHKRSNSLQSHNARADVSHAMLTTACKPQRKQRSITSQGNNCLQSSNTRHDLSHVESATEVPMHATTSRGSKKIAPMTYSKSKKQQLANHDAGNDLSQVWKHQLQRLNGSIDPSRVKSTTACKITLQATAHHRSV